MKFESRLGEIATALGRGESVSPVSIRKFLGWAGVMRRTRLNVEYIDRRLAEAHLRTVPNYCEAWVDDPILFELVEHQRGEDAASAGAEPAVSLEPEYLDHSSPDDPSFKIGKIVNSQQGPVCVKPNASLKEAQTIMLARNFSQLPVMTSERDVKGIISWTSIGARAAANLVGDDVQTYMDEAREISTSATFFEAVRMIKEHDYVLVRAGDRKIVGILTATDIAEQFENISKPFLLLAEIENHLRSLVAKKLTKADIRRACGAEYLPENLSATSELTFGNLVRILEHAENWNKLGLQLDRSTFCTELSDINRIRNDVMHFDPDPLSDENIAKLRNVSHLFDKLRQMGAF